jgi:hypothetical protein
MNLKKSTTTNSEGVFSMREFFGCLRSLGMELSPMNGMRTVTNCAYYCTTTSGTVHSTYSVPMYCTGTARFDGLCWDSAGTTSSSREQQQQQQQQRVFFVKFSLSIVEFSESCLLFIIQMNKHSLLQQ